MPTFTGFCTDAQGNHFTMHIASVEANDLTDAAALARTACATDWECAEDDVLLLGIAAGDVDILAWNDAGITSEDL